MRVLGGLFVLFHANIFFSSLYRLLFGAGGETNGWSLAVTHSLVMWSICRNDVDLISRLYFILRGGYLGHGWVSFNVWEWALEESFLDRGLKGRWWATFFHPRRMDTISKQKNGNNQYIFGVASILISLCSQLLPFLTNSRRFFHSLGPYLTCSSS